MYRLLVCLAGVAFGICMPMGALAAPQIYWSSDPVSPGDTVLVSGDGLQSIVNVEITRLNDLRDDTSATGDSTTVKPIQARDQSVKFTIPETLRVGVYRYRLITRDGVAESCLNCPTIYWTQGDLGKRSTPGGWIRILGRNIERSRAATLVLKRNDDLGSQVFLQAKDGDLWDARFGLPANLSPGTYALKLWNGEGNGTTWHEAGVLQVEAPRPKPTETLNAREQGAVGDGVHDDTPAVRRALLHLRAKGGGTLFFPRGRYLLNDPLVVPDGVSIRGEGRELVSLNWPEFSIPPSALVSGYSDFSISDVTLYASNYTSVISGGFEAPSPQKNAIPAANISIMRVTIRASAYRGHIEAQQGMERYVAGFKNSIINGPNTIRLGGENLVVTDCDVYGSGSVLLLLHPRRAYLARNQFFNGRGGWYSITGADGVIFEDNQVTGGDSESSGGSINTLGRTSSFSRNVLFKRNAFRLMNGWDREAITSDGPGGYYFGRIRSLGDKEVELLDPVPQTRDLPADMQGAGVFVVSGAGRGQYARIENALGERVKVDRPLALRDANTSIAAIVPLQENYLIIGNEFSDTGVATQFYGTAVNHVVANNVSIRTGGFLNRGSHYHHFQPSWYIQFLENRIEEGAVYRGGSNNAVFSGEAVIGTYGVQAGGGNFPPFVLGTVIRGNVLKNNAHIEVKGLSYKFPGVRDVLIERNSVANADAGLIADRGSAAVLARENLFERVTNPLLDNSQ